MGLEAPVRGRIHTGGGECCKAKFVLAGGDVLGNLLQVCEALDIIGGVTGLFQQGLVGDQAVALDNVADGHGGVAIFQGVRIAGQVAQDLGAGQVIAVILPVGQADRAVDLEQGGCIALGHFAHQSGFVLAGSSGHNGNGNAGLFGVGLCQGLPGFILLGLEVQVVDLAGGSGICRGGCFGAGSFGRSCGAFCSRGSSGRCGGAATCQQAGSHHGCQGERDCLLGFHGIVLLFKWNQLHRCGSVWFTGW